MSQDERTEPGRVPRGAHAAGEPPARRVPDRPPSRAERREQSLSMVGLLARALVGQLEEIDRAADPAPDGWWFTPPHRARQA